MITLHTWGTPNGTKIVIALEELALPYKIVPVNLAQKEQRKAEFLALNPNGKIPVIVDDQGPDSTRFVLWESGAILIYLAEKAGRLLPTGSGERHLAIQWLMFQMSGIGPAIGQFHHFTTAPEQIPYALDRFRTEARRQLGVLNARLDGSEYLAGAEYSVADVSTWPWIRSWLHTVHQDLTDFPAVRRWFDRIAERHAVKVGVDVYNRLRNQTAPGAGR